MRCFYIRVLFFIVSIRSLIRANATLRAICKERKLTKSDGLRIDTTTHVDLTASGKVRETVEFVLTKVQSS